MTDSGKITAADACAAWARLADTVTALERDAARALRAQDGSPEADAVAHAALDAWRQAREDAKKAWGVYLAARCDA
jgi:hypothetical protein